MMESDTHSERSWFRRLLHRTSAAPRAGRAQTAQSGGLTVERLEDRCQPAALIGVSDDVTLISSGSIGYGESSFYMRETDGSFGNNEFDYIKLLGDEWSSLDEWSFGGGSQGYEYGIDGGYFGAGREVAPANSTDVANGYGPPGGYVNPSDGVPHPDSPYASNEMETLDTPGGWGGSALTPAVAPDTRFRGGRDVLPANSAHLAYGGGYTLGFDGNLPATDNSPADMLKTTDETGAKLEGEPIADDDAPDRPARPAAPLRAAAGVSQTFELSGAPDDLRASLEEGEPAPLESSAAVKVDVDPTTAANSAVEGAEPEEEAPHDPADVVDGIVMFESSADDLFDPRSTSASDAFWAAVSEDDDGPPVRPGQTSSTCLFDRHDHLFQKTSAIAAAALVSLLHRSWMRRRRRSQGAV